MDEWDDLHGILGRLPRHKQEGRKKEEVQAGMEERSKKCEQGGGEPKKYQQLEKLEHSPWVCSDSLKGRMEDA